MRTEKKCEKETKTKLSIKLIIDIEAKKVLYAEADQELVNFLYSLLALPLGTMSRLLKNQSVMGCISNIYDSLENMSSTYIQPNVKKNELLKRHLGISVGNIAVLPPGMWRTGKHYRCTKHNNFVTSSYDSKKSACPGCGRSMKTTEPNIDSIGYVKEAVIYMVTDDLNVTPLSSIDILKKISCTSKTSLEVKVVDITTKEILKLLKACVLSENNVLSKVFLQKKHSQSSSSDSSSDSDLSTDSDSSSDSDLSTDNSSSASGLMM